jgi:glutathione S-transferase
MVFEEKGLKYSVIEEDLGNLSEALLGLHPEGKVPLLVHGEQAIYESSVITEYLDEVFPTPALMPASAGARAEVRLWTYWCNTVLKPDVDLLKYEWRRIQQSEQDVLKLRIAAHLEKIDQALDASLFLMGPKLTLADIHIFPFYRQLQKSQPFFHEAFKPRHLNAWLERITSRPSFERVMKKKQETPVP